MRKSRLRAIGARMRKRHRATRVFRAIVLQRAGGSCERCTVKHGRRLHAHHRIPRSRGGSDHPDNGAALCRRCHRAVHDHTAGDWREWIR